MAWKLFNCALFFSIGAGLANTTLGQASASTTSSSIPIAGDAIKAGDIIIWGANRNILKPYETPTPATNAPVATTVTLADKAAAAIKLQKTAQDAVTAAANSDGFSTNPPSAAAITALAEARQLLTIANANVKSANATAYAAEKGSSTGVGL